MRVQVVMVCLALLWTGCAGVPRTHWRQRSARIPVGTVMIVPPSGGGTRQALDLGLLEVDAFEALLVRAGLEDLDALPLRVNPFTPEAATEVMGCLIQSPVTLGTLPPRQVVGFLLWHFAEREVAEVVRELFRNEGLGSIKVVHTQASW
ncbi:hypothetical protein D7V97_08185 [Corallococcus sp. CA053C]|uniref:hypothetical protein n=1 Tax=Corallococcus sp. CA053C TaxID=2316732 RepID=UPI000EA3B39E|nr:hypothetical protein [Corallococcus sp. CA053C]RKH12512.1 hypothetical protein D7V97_08185 [Corallococcus sp. CA053C]